jgi:PPK2 family polyphosphate:nucleotide phosphotransferase
VKRYRIDPDADVNLDKFDPDDTSLVPDGKQAGREENEKMQEKLRELQEKLYADRRHKLLIILQGMDTSGKDGTVRHVMGAFDPSGVRVVPFKKPTETELAHDYLWRVHAQVPGSGEVVVFNRSHYEDVLVVRVHNLVAEDVWKQRYDQINEFERMLTDTGTTILKFFLHISAKEQKKRLTERIEDPTKRWKFQHGDIEERKLWGDYRKAYEVALRKTSTEWAPWWVVPANAKWYRNYIVGSVIVKAMEKMDLKYPEVDLSGVVISD